MPIAALDSGTGGGAPAPAVVRTNHQQLRRWRGMRSFILVAVIVLVVLCG